MSSKIEILLRENVEHLGRCGDLVQVKSGYARNYLYPRRLAVDANPDNLRIMARRRARLDADEEKRVLEIDALVAKLAAVVVTTKAKADEQGHLYGSVNAGQIAELLQKAGHPLSEKDIRLDTPIKSVGKHLIKLHVYGDRTAEISLMVEAEMS